METTGQPVAEDQSCVVAPVQDIVHLAKHDTYGYRYQRSLAIDFTLVS